MSAAAPPAAVPVAVEVHVRYEDVTPAMHVGNAAILSLIEEARNRLLWFGGTAPGAVDVAGLFSERGAGRGFLVAAQTIEYLAEMKYQPEPLRIEFWVGHVGGSSFTLDAQIRAAAGAPALVRTESVIVVTDAETGAPSRIGDSLRTRLQGILGEPVAQIGRAHV